MTIGIGPSCDAFRFDPAGRTVVLDRFGILDVLVVIARRAAAGALDLDPDVEHLARLALAGAHQLEVADEASDRQGGEPFRAGLVSHLVLELGHVRDEIRFALGIDRVDGEPAGRGGEQVVAPVRIATGLADLDERPDAGQRERFASPDLRPFTDEDDPERRAGVEAVARQAR